MDSNHYLNIETSKIININSDKTEKKGLLKANEIIDKTKDNKDTEKIKKINSKTLSGDNTQSTLEQYKLDNRIEPSLSDTKEKDKIREIKSKNPILNERTNASLSKANRMQNKTAIIKEKCIRYMINPDKQVEDILEYVESSIKNHPLKSTYDFAKQLVEIDDLRNISEDMQKELEEVTKKGEFFLILTNLHKINMYQKELKHYVENNQYPYNPLAIAQIAEMANVLLLSDNKLVLESVESRVDRNKFLDEIKDKPLSHFISEIPAGSNLNQQPDFYHFYKHFYPIILCGDLALYSFEAEIYAYANNLFFLGVGGSDRGVHGGSFHTPLEVFDHDILHHFNMLSIDSPIQAIYLQQLSKSLLEIIQFSISENLRASFYFAAHLLLHEGRFAKIEENFGNKNPNLSTVFNLVFGDYLKILFRAEFALEPVDGFSEDYLNNLEFHNSDKTELKVRDSTPENYDIVEAILFLPDDPKKKEELQNKILPNFSTAAKSLMKDCRIKHHITDETDRNSELFNAYRKDYNNQLYLYKVHNYDQIEAYNAIKELLINFKKKIIPHLEEIDKKNGPIDVSNYKDVWEQGQEIG